MGTIEATDPLPADGRSSESSAENEDERPFFTVGLTYNLKRGIKSDVEDIEAEYDSIDTVTAIKDAIEKLNCKVELLEADSSVLKKLQEKRIDIVFNIAEGIHGRGREAQIPAILNFLRIPFTGSDETTLYITLDKALTKRILSTYKIKTPAHILINGNEIKGTRNLKFPLIVKPNAEGSSKGIWDSAVVHNFEQLKSLVQKNRELYGQSMLVEEFICGREFTVAIVGNGSDTIVFPPMEIVYKDRNNRHNIYSYNVKKNYKQFVDYVCPAPIDKNIETRMMRIARKIYEILECKDFSRIDFRLSEEGEIFFIEINPLPGLAPGYSDFPMIAEFNGVDYGTVIKMVLNSGLRRYGMKPVL